MIILTPAYGRDYKSAKAVHEDYHDGKDFILNDFLSPYDGKPCSIRDFPNQSVKIRYANLKKVCVTSLPAEKPKPKVCADISFGKWMAQVNQALNELTGLGADDLADIDYFSLFADGVNPSQAALDCLAENDYPG